VRSRSSEKGFGCPRVTQLVNRTVGILSGPMDCTARTLPTMSPVYNGPLPWELRPLLSPFSCSVKPHSDDKAEKRGYTAFQSVANCAELVSDLWEPTWMVPERCNLDQAGVQKKESLMRPASYRYTGWS
jgi:hypothetical protein